VTDHHATLADLGRLIDRADAEASRLRARRLAAWAAARRDGLSWREIARASGLSDHASVQKAVRREGVGLMPDGRERTATTCSPCDDLRKRKGTPQLVGQPCDICDGRGIDYLGRACRHAPHSGSQEVGS
jgi:hypothetical protein